MKNAEIITTHQGPNRVIAHNSVFITEPYLAHNTLSSKTQSYALPIHRTLVTQSSLGNNDIFKKNCYILYEKACGLSILSCFHYTHFFISKLCPNYKLCTNYLFANYTFDLCLLFLWFFVLELFRSCWLNCCQLILWTCSSVSTRSSSAIQVVCTKNETFPGCSMLQSIS